MSKLGGKFKEIENNTMLFTLFLVQQLIFLSLFGVESCNNNLILDKSWKEKKKTKRNVCDRCCFPGKYPGNLHFMEIIYRGFEHETVKLWSYDKQHLLLISVKLRLNKVPAIAFKVEKLYIEKKFNLS